jgi:hypothetical protein
VADFDAIQYIKVAFFLRRIKSNERMKCEIWASVKGTVMVLHRDKDGKGQYFELALKKPLSICIGSYNAILKYSRTERRYGGLISIRSVERLKVFAHSGLACFHANVPDSPEKSHTEE